MPRSLPSGGLTAHRTAAHGAPSASVVWLALACLFAMTVAPRPALGQPAPEAASAESPESEGTPARRRPKKRRPGGVDPCMTPDPGWGVYDRWSRSISMGQMIAPQTGGLTRQGGFDLLVHFHGHEPVRKEFVKEAKGIVLVGIDLGIGSIAYSGPFSSPHTFENLIKSVEAEMSRRTGKKTHVRKLGLSAWSAGYGAITQILQQPLGKKVDAVILLDSVHTAYVTPDSTELRTTGLEPFVQFAQQASKGGKLMFQSYSSIQPPGYASTREVAHHVIDRLGGKPRKAKGNDVLGLSLFERYDRRNYRARGYRGNDKPDHCAHLGLMATVLRQSLKKRWGTPLGRLGVRPVAKAKPVAARGGSVHVVASGQTLGGIARRYKISVKELRELNGLERGKPIQIGQELVVPAVVKPPLTEPAKKRAPKPEPKKGPGRVAKADKGKGKVHVVADGHSLRKIAKRYNVSIEAIREANDMPAGSSRIVPGQRLVIPEKR